MNYLFALIPAICWGCLATLVTILDGNPKKQMFGVVSGATFLAIILNIIKFPEYNVFTIILGLLTGFFWTVGFYYQLTSFKLIGVTSAVVISTGMQLIFTTSFSVIILKEWKNLNQFLIGIPTILIIILSIKLCSYKKNNFNSTENNLRKALKVLFISSLGFLIYATFVQVFKIDAYSIILPQTIGMLLGAIFFIRGKIKEFIDFQYIKLFIPGFLWLIGNICMYISYSKIGVTISFVLSQLNIVVSTALSILVLKEKKSKTELFALYLGISLFLFASFILTILK